MKPPWPVSYTHLDVYKRQAFYYALSWLAGLLLSFLDLAVANPNDAYISGLAGSNFRLIAVCTVLLAPLVEETLFRGLIFGNLHQKSRVAAYAVSALIFAAIHVWQYAVSYTHLDVYKRQLPACAPQAGQASSPSS